MYIAICHFSTPFPIFLSFLTAIDCIHNLTIYRNSCKHDKEKVMFDSGKKDAFQMGHYVKIRTLFNQV
ncbi:hypothetical protein J1TS3_20260 [Siminovitchia fordii]|uniref:Uncharacterized protein n=1 Tax=Siminovitchia fordii TaxID=254759 RepID=A0ABQ4K584_9BACI|nr:hypothetical protein J1TS3_20260 [Siminovitchia fordii]